MLPQFKTSQRLRVLALIIIVVISSMVFIQLFTRISFQYDSFSFTLKANFNPSGGAVLNIPPVGQLFLKTHYTPWQFIFTLDAIDFATLEKQLDSIPAKEEWLKTLQRETLHAVLKLFILIIITGMTGAILTLLIFRIKPFSKDFWYGILGTLTLILMFIITTALTYDPDAIDCPQYRGVLASAPWAMNLVTMGLDNIEIIGDNLKKISQDIPLLFKQAGQIKNIGDLQFDIAALHVSDIHNNPAAFEFITELVNNFKIQFIIDTGDLTDYGTPLEAEIIKRIARIRIPYIFLPGNHDSPLIIKRLKKIPFVKVLEEGIITVKGLTIAGQSDPAALSYNSDVASEADLKKAAEALSKTVQNAKTNPHIILTHNRKVVVDLIGQVPLILHGHDHQYRLTTESGTIINDAGTTGAAGLRGLTEEGVAYSAAILYWKKGQNGALTFKALDSIKINGVAGKLTIERHTF
jgi:Icc-related predicted phosphoesterase